MKNSHPELKPTPADMVAAVGEEHAAFWLACGVTAGEAAVLSETIIGGRAQRRGAWDWLDADGIARLLNVPLLVLANLYHQGHIPQLRTHPRHGKGARVRDVMRWLASGIPDPDRGEPNLVPSLIVGSTGGAG